MAYESALGAVSRLSAQQLGVFRGRAAVRQGVTRKQLAALVAAGAVERMLPDTYRLTGVARSQEQELRAALLWAGDTAAAACCSAGALYGLEGVTAPVPEIVVPASARVRSDLVVVRRSHTKTALMVREVRGLRATGIECTLLALGATLGEEAFEIACEDARRRRLTSVAALRAYLQRHARPGRPGVAAMRDLLDQLDPVHAARSTLEVKTRRLLVANRITNFVREFPLEGTAAVICSTLPSTRNGRFSRPTAAAGTTTPPTTKATMTNGVCPAATGTASFSPHGTR